jgi:hypothetical protein
MTDQYKLMRHLLSDRIVAFHPSLALALGGVNEALIFQQIAYWTGKGADPEWVYKTRAEFYEETTLTRTQQENARKNLRRLGVIEEERRGLPARIYFRINWDVLFRLLSVQSAANLPTSRREARQPVGGKPTDLSAGLPPTSKSTSESIKDEDWSEPKMPRTLEELDDWERRMEERRRWIKGIDRSAD